MHHPGWAAPRVGTRRSVRLSPRTTRAHPIVAARPAACSLVDVPFEQVLVLTLFAVLAILAMSVALVAAWLAGHRQSAAAFRAAIAPAQPAVSATPARDLDREPLPEQSALAGLVAVDRAIRVVSLLFIAGAGLVVALTHAWPAAEGVVWAILGIATIIVVLVQELLPALVRVGPVRYWISAIASIAVVSALVEVTGGALSPFALGYFLIVAGAALAIAGPAPMALSVVAAAAWALVSIVDALTEGISTVGVATVGVGVITLVLIAWVGTVGGREQRRARDDALRLSRFDALTGLANRAAFFAAVEREIRRVGRTGYGFSLLMLDLDDLKPVNDTFGHPAGDDLLRAITAVVTRTIRATDTAGRYGGDEFMILLPETDAEGAFVLGEKLRRDVAALGLRIGERTVRTSVSIGLVAYPEDGTTVEALFSAVDAAMYEAKRRGKNEIVGYATRTERVATAIAPARDAGFRGRPESDPLDRAPERGERGDRGDRGSDRPRPAAVDDRYPSLPPQPLPTWTAADDRRRAVPVEDERDLPPRRRGYDAAVDQDAPRRSTRLGGSRAGDERDADDRDERAERGTGTFGDAGRRGPTSIEEPNGRRYVVFPIDPDDRRG